MSYIYPRKGNFMTTFEGSHFFRYKHLLKWVFAFIVLFILSSSAGVVRAQAVLTIDPLTWDIIGLDSNKPDPPDNEGPADFMSGARVCNVGASDATNVTVTYIWDSANPYIDFTPGTTSVLTNAVIRAGRCRDYYFSISIVRDPAAWDTARQYHIEATADTLGTVSTPLGRQLYVEQLIEQNRNDVRGMGIYEGAIPPSIYPMDPPYDSISFVALPATMTVYIGQTYTFLLDSATAPGGYEQLETFINFPNHMYRLLYVRTLYATPPNATGDGIYADACGWDANPLSPTYNSCIGPENYPGGNVGGDPIYTGFVVQVLPPALGTTTLNTLIFDKSGASYHYNTDYSSATLTLIATLPPDLSVTKVDSADPVTVGDTFSYTIAVTNNGPSTANNVIVTDTFSGTSVTVVSVSSSQGGCTAFPCNLGSIPSGVTATITVTVIANETGTITNTVAVAGDEPDPDPTNNSATETTTVIGNPTPAPSSTLTQSDPFITKVAEPPFAIPGEVVVWKITVMNPGSTPVNNVEVVDNLPNQVQIISASATGGTVTTSGQTVRWSKPVLNPGESVTITVTTRVRSDVAVPFSITNLATFSIDSRPIQTVQAVVHSVTNLPRTGESPWAALRWGMLTVLASIGIFGAWQLQRRMKAKM
jgi:uncharacterized repeat protein (TIGR01451 family)